MNDNEVESIVNERRHKFSVWLGENNLQDYQSAFEEEGFNDLAVLAELSDAEVEELASGMRMKMGHKKKLPIAIRNLKEEREEEKEQKIKRKEKEKEEEEDRKLKRKRAKEEMTEEHPEKRKEGLIVHKPDSVVMPANKDYFAFLSHKKKNSKLGSATEGLALRVKDHLDLTLGKTFFDVDNLKKITMEALTEAVQRSVAVVLFLDDETTQSSWVVHELKTAQEAGIPIIVVIDNENYNQRDLIDMYSKLGFSFLFGEQVIGHSAEYRKAAYEKIRDAVVNAIVTTGTTKTRAVAHNVETTSKQTSGDFMPSADEQFRSLVFEIYSSVEVAWGVFDGISEPRGQLSRTDFKAVLKMLHLTISTKERGKLRKKMDPTNSKFITFQEFQALVADDDAVATKSGDPESAFLAKLPVDMPTLPDNYRYRPDVEHQIFDLLMDKAPCKGSTCAVHGMGGAGKSCVTAAVVITTEIRKRFSSVAWIGISQRPKIQRLQRRLHFQLSGKHMPKDKEGSSEQQLQYLQSIFEKKNIIVVIDDCWDRDHYKMFDIIDKSTNSRCLISTRIHGLVSSNACTEVKLGLMSTQEAIDLLSHGSGLDSVAVAPSMIEVSNLCGNLPLCLNIASQMISDAGADWEDEVLSDLRHDMSQSIEDASGVQLSIQDKIIVTSLNSITGKDTAQTKELFMGSFVFSEDQRIPNRVFSVLHASIVKLNAGSKEEPETAASTTAIRRMVSVLVKRSLFLELVKGSTQLHDIVRDYVLVEAKKKGIQKLQKLFVVEFISSQHSWEQISGERILKGGDLNWFMSSGSLQWHISEAWSKPLVSDAEACSWLLSDNATVQAQSVNAIPAAEVVRLAQHYAGREEHRTASELYFATVYYCFLPAEESTRLAKLCIEAMQNVPESQQDDRCNDILVRAGLKIFLQGEPGSPYWLMGMGLLLQLYQSGVKMADLTAGQVLVIVAAVKMGFTSQNPNPPIEERMLGFKMYRDACHHHWLAFLYDETLRASPASHHGADAFSRCYMTWVPSDNWTVPLRDQEREAASRDAILQSSRAYDFEAFHEFVMTGYAYDPALETGANTTLAPLRHADLQASAEVSRIWADAELKRYGIGENMGLEWFTTVGMFRWMQDMTYIHEVATAAGLTSWASMDTMATDIAFTIARWTSADGEHFSFLPETMITHARMELLLCTPRMVETAEFIAWLPNAGESPLLTDSACQIYGLLEPFAVLFAKAAFEFGDVEAASAHARATLGAGFFQSQWKKTHAKAALAKFLSDD